MLRQFNLEPHTFYFEVEQLAQLVLNDFQQLTEHARIWREVFRLKSLQPYRDMLFINDRRNRIARGEIGKVVASFDNINRCVVDWLINKNTYVTFTGLDEAVLLLRPLKAWCICVLMMQMKYSPFRARLWKIGSVAE